MFAYNCFKAQINKIEGALKKKYKIVKFLRDRDSYSRCVVIAGSGQKFTLERYSKAPEF